MARYSEIMCDIWRAAQLIPQINHLEGFEKHFQEGAIATLARKLLELPPSNMSPQEHRIYVFNMLWRTLGPSLHEHTGKTEEEAKLAVDEELEADAEIRQKLDAAKQSRDERKKVTKVCTFSAEGCVTTAKTLKCSRCKIAKYCSKDCQTAHWPEHRKVCVAPSASSSSSSSSAVT